MRNCNLLYETKLLFNKNLVVGFGSESNNFWKALHNITIFEKTFTS